MVGNRNLIECILRGKPEMPRPDDSATLLDGNNGITALDVACLNLEVEESITTIMRDRKRRNKVSSISPNNLCPIDTCIGSAVGLLYPWVADIGTCMVFKVIQDRRITRRRMADVRLIVTYTVLNGITINEWDTVMTGSRDKIRVGSVA